MTDAKVPAAADEGLHEPDSAPLWSESHYLDVVNSDAGTGVYVRLGRLPNLDASHVMLAIVRPGAGPVMIADAQAPLPRTPGRDLGLTGDDYELEIHNAEPLRRVRVTARGTATAYEQPADPLHEVPGRPVAFELDLSWGTAAVPHDSAFTTRYEVPCHVTGRVVVDGETIDVDWAGQRDHSWGVRDWWAFEWCWTALHLNDGTHLHSVALSRGGMGYTQRDGVVIEPRQVRASTEPRDPGLFGVTTVDMRPDGPLLTLVPVAFAPVRMVAQDGRVAFFSRATCLVSTAEGSRGVGWLEWNQLQP